MGTGSEDDTFVKILYVLIFTCVNKTKVVANGTIVAKNKNKENKQNPECRNKTIRRENLEKF